MTHRARMKHHHPFEAQPPRPIKDAGGKLYPHPCRHLGAPSISYRPLAIGYSGAPASGTARFKAIQGHSSPFKVIPAVKNLCTQACPSPLPPAPHYLCANLRHLRTSRLSHLSRRLVAPTCRAKAQRRRERSEGGSAAQADSNLCKSLKNTPKHTKTHQNTVKHTKTHAKKKFSVQLSSVWQPRPPPAAS